MVSSLPFPHRLLCSPDVGADVLDLAETMVTSTEGLVYEPVCAIISFVCMVCTCTFTLVLGDL